MAKNTIEDLRDHLFATIEALTDNEKPMDVERAKAVATVAGKIIESAKVEVKLLEATGAEADSSFFTGKTRQPSLPPGPKVVNR